MITNNYHTHTTYDDGNNSTEEMVIAAIKKGMSVLGFSGHSNTAFDQRYCMTKEKTALYINELTSLKEKYKGKLEILIGIEQDYYGDTPEYSYDYVIGSCHYLKTPSGYMPIDDSLEDMLKCVNEDYDGKFLSYARDYFEMVSSVKLKTGCDIVGHFDLISKFNENDKVYNSRDFKYLSYAYEAVKTLCSQDAVFEINTGAMWKKYRTDPYPQADILKAIYEYGGKITFSSDSHDTASLCCYFDEAAELARICGFHEYVDFSDKKGILLPL